MRMVRILAYALVFSLSALHAQDLVTYDRVDNATVGLTPVPFEKWGQAIADIDGNGWLDIFTRRWGGSDFSRIHLNDGGIFQDISGQTPLESLEPGETHTRTVSLVDFDNDGDQDIFFGTDRNLFLLQNDDNVFTDIAQSVGLIGQKPPGLISRWGYNIGAWADIDLDGDLDILVHQSNNPDLFLYRNDNGTFVNAAAEYGFLSVDPTSVSWDGGSSYSRVHWVDFDMDGDLDLSTGPSLFMNDGGQFTEVAASIGFTPSLPINNSDWFDYDSDGDLDFIKTCNFETDPGCGTELWEYDNGTFVQRTDVINTSNLINLTRGMAVADYDNDGDQDVFLNNSQVNFRDAFLLNEDLGDGVRVMEDIAEFIGLTDTGSRKGGGFIDYDKDGFVDLYVPSDDGHRLYRNQASSNNWVGFILEGTQSNRDAIGAMVRLVAGGVTQVRHRKTPSDWLRQDNTWLHFGIGQNTSIDSVVIRWPLGQVQVLADVSINQYHDIKEPQITSVESGDDLTRIPGDWRLHQNYPNPFNPATTIVYEVPTEEWVVINVYNTLGQRVTTLVNRRHATGRYAVTWNGRNNRGIAVESGVYFVRMQAGDFVDSQTMTLVK